MREGSLDAVIGRLGVIPRWRVTPVVLAAVVLALPVVQGGSGRYQGLTYGQIAVIAFIALVTGWAFVDRMLAFRASLVLTAVVLVGATCAIAVTGQLAFHHAGPERSATIVLAIAGVTGAAIRGIRPDRRSMGALVALAAAASWLAYDIARLPIQPLRDLHLYLGAGRAILAGASPYATGPITSTADPDKLPFVYPPLTTPIFVALAALPRALAETIWVGGSVLAVVAALWLLGVRGRWLVVMLAWPSIALGIAVGNVASYTFFLYVLGFRVGAAIVLSGAFKVQSALPTLWLLRERRWRSIAVGVAILAAMTLLALPLVSPHAWIDWWFALQYFQQSFQTFPGIQGYSIQHLLGPTVAAGMTILATGFALLAASRNGLARFGLASIVASPTLSFHGLSPALAGALVLGPELLWFVLGLGPWSVETVWAAVIVVALATLFADRELSLPPDLSAARADIHPAAASERVWPGTT